EASSTDGGEGAAADAEGDQDSGGVEEVEATSAEPSGRSSGRGSTRRRRPTDASVKEELRRRARKRCGGLGVPGTSVRVSLSVDPTGALTLARTEAPHASGSLGKCVREAMDGARFPATGDRRVLPLTVVL
ncbi:MAG: hypothetical protein KDK70_36590, partial [Myxococcales bacterium]|nr:hypothetical protein [Myxococcales bacterium]